MKVTTYQEAVDTFKPVTVTITIESREELRELTARLNASLNTFAEYALRHDAPKVADWVSKAYSETHKLWSVLDRLCSKYHVDYE